MLPGTLTNTFPILLQRTERGSESYPEKSREGEEHRQRLGDLQAKSRALHAGSLSKAHVEVDGVKLHVFVCMCVCAWRGEGALRFHG